MSDAAHAHRRLFPGNDAARRHLCWVAALAPLSAIRAGQAVARDTFACHDPVTVAAEFCGDEAFRRFARDTLCDLRHPRPAAVPEENPAAARVEAWFRERVTQHTERFLRAAGVDPAALLAPPAPGGPADRGYCPRCRAVYVRADGDCSDCGGVALVPLASAAG